MSQGDYVRIDSKHAVETQLPFLLRRIEGWDYSVPLVVKLERYDDPRTNSQNNLFHKWCRQMSDAFIEKVPDATEENMKFMMKSMFLGTETITIGKETYPDQIKPTPKHKGEMCYFMDQVYAWAADRKVFLSLPEYNEYTELKRKQEQ